MSEAQTRPDLSLLPVERPRCPKRQNRMNLTRIMPGQRGFGMRAQVPQQLCSAAPDLEPAGQRASDATAARTPCNFGDVSAMVTPGNSWPSDDFT